jgi:hypothetical protein
LGQIFSLVRNNPELAEQVAGMVFYGVKQTDFSMHFFRLLTLLTEFSGGPSGMPCFTNLVMHKVKKNDIVLSVLSAFLIWKQNDGLESGWVETNLPNIHIFPTDIRYRSTIRR